MRTDGDFSSLSMYVCMCICLYAYACFLYLPDWLTDWLSEWASEWERVNMSGPISPYILVLLWIYLSIYRSLASSCCSFLRSQFSVRFGSTYSVEILSSIGLKVVCFFSLLKTATGSSSNSIKFTQKEILQNIRYLFLSSYPHTFDVIFYDVNLFIWWILCEANKIAILNLVKFIEEKR